MSKMSRLFSLASKAIDKASSSSTGRDNASSSSGDWRGMVRNAAEALTGDGRNAAPAGGYGRSPRAPHADADRAAIARYDYLMQTAGPHQVELIHREAFSRLTPAQREQVESRMRTELAPHERPVSASAPDLARAAARSEALKPGRTRGLLARAGGTAGLAGAGLAAGGVLATVAGGAVVSSVAAPLLEHAAAVGVDFDALAESVDVDAIASGAEGMLGSAGEHASGLGEQASGFGDRVADLGLPDIRDLFGR